MARWRSRSLETVRRSFALLDRRSRRLFALAATAQALTAALDLVAIILVGLVVAGASTVALGAPSGAVYGLILELVPTTPEGIIGFAALAGLILVLKSVLSLFLTRRTYQFLVNRSALVSSFLADDVLSLPLLEVQRRASQQLAQALTSGVNAATVTTLGPLSMIISEAALTTFLLAGLTAVDPIVALFTVTFFGLVAVLLQLSLGRWAHRIGAQGAQAEIGSITALQHALRAYRELVVAHRRGLFVQRFEHLRWRSASVTADYFILSQAGKYVFEVALVLGAGALVVILATTRSIESAVLALTVFLLVATRMFPSILRMQGAFTQLRLSEGAATELFSLRDDLLAYRQSNPASSPVAAATEPFQAEVRLENVTVRYPGANERALDNVSLHISSGESVAIVGATGAGKSTLADAILGVVRPLSGTVLLSGRVPQEAVALWPGRVAYVPQDVAVLSGTVRENVALGFPDDQINDSDVWAGLERAHLAAFLAGSRDGLDTVVGEHGVRLSGGQRQRLGIARALFTRPKLLVMDEATSALDAETERDITRTLEDISGEITTVVIAHRLATVQNCSLVVYLDGGRVLSTGTFDDVRQAVPAFDRQARLLGL